MKRFFLLFFMVIIAHISCGQEATRDTNFWDDVHYGGNFGLGFNNGGFNISIAPSAIYPINDKFSVGTGLNFNYSKFEASKFLAYGGSLITLYNPIQLLQLSLELEQLRIARTLNLISDSRTSQYWLPSLYAGVGYRSRNVTFGIRYDLLYNDKKSIYPSALLPFVRLYF